jgi:REP element-mobilizing transposase RayT
LGAIVLNFKSVTTRRINGMRRSPGTPVWQRNYYEHIIRDDASWQSIRQYIHNNPLAWQQDQLHPNNPLR